MPKGDNSKINKKMPNTRSKKALEEEKRKLKENSKGPDDNGGDSDEDDEEYVDRTEMKKFFKKMFPNKSSKDIEKEMKEHEDCDKEKTKKKSPSAKKQNEKIETTTKEKSKKTKKLKNLKEEETSSSSSESDSDDSADSDFDSDVDPDELEGLVADQGKSLNIIFTIGGERETDDEDSSSEGSNSSSSDDDDELEDQYHAAFMGDKQREDDDECKESSDESSEDEAEKKVKKDKKKSTKKSPPAKELKSSKEDAELNEVEILDKFRDLAKDLAGTNKSSKILKEIVEMGEQKEKELKKTKKKTEKKQRGKNFIKFRKLVKEKNVMDDYKYFKKMEVKDQAGVLNQLEIVNKVSKINKPYRISLLESDIPEEYKSIALKKINSLRYMGPGDGEYYKIKTWVDTFMRIPFNTFETLPINIKDGVEPCHEFMAGAKKCLDDAAYGLNDAKMQIMQLIGQLISNPKAVGTAIAIKGPMGTGKTTLVKEGISKILKRPFAFIPLGGATDSSFLEGHSYTYEGSLWGKIVDILIQSKCMNPVFYFDELDKVSDTAKGEEIIGILTHLTDTSQNNEFHDKYFSEIDFDLSRALFIFSYNNEECINPILRDRMYKIETKGYNKKDKTVICDDYLAPKIQENVNFKKEDIIIPPDTLAYIIETYTEEEKGVRNLKRCIEIIYTKLNLYRLMKPETNLFEQDLSLKVEFPFTVTVDVVKKLIKKEEKMSFGHMYL